MHGWRAYDAGGTVRVMPIRIVQLGTPRAAGEGVRLGTVRRPPRGVPKSEFARRDFYDVWLPNLSPSPELVAQGLSAADARDWKAFCRKFTAEMNRPDAARVLDVLAALSHQSDFSLGCYCEDEGRCHRSVLRELLAQRGAAIVIPAEAGTQGVGKARGAHS
jgi:uncharacterized protein YeaO (DUF488 family)